MNIRGLCVVLLLLARTVTVVGQDTLKQPWTLKQCIEYAIEHNINVRQQVLEKENQELALTTSQYSRLPDLNANVGQDFYFGRGPGRDGTYQDQSQASSSLRVSASVPVFSGFRINNDVKAKKMNLQAALEELNRAKEDLSLNITSFYLKVLLCKELLSVAEDQVLLSKEQVGQTEILVRGGKSPESELFDARAALAREELTRTEAANNLQLALVDLSQMLNLETPEQFDIVLPDMDGVVLGEMLNLQTPVEVFTHSVNNRPVVKAAEFRLQSSEKDLKVARSAYYPTLSLGASYSNSYYHTYNLDEGLRNPSFSSQMSNNGSESVGLNLSIPIFNRLSTRNQVRMARISVENRQLLLDDVKLSLYKEIQQAYYNAVAAHEKFRSSERSVEASRIAFKYEEQKYNAGKSTSYQFNDIKTRLAKSLSEAIQAKYNFIFLSKILDFYNGTPLY